MVGTSGCFNGTHFWIFLDRDLPRDLPRDLIPDLTPTIHLVISTTHRGKNEIFCYWRLNAGFRHFAKIREKFTLRARSRQREEVIYWFWWRLKATIHSFRLVYDTCLILVFRRLRGQMNARQNAFFEKRPISNSFSATRCNTTSMCHDLIHSILS